MKEKIERYIRKKKRERVLKLLRENIVVIWGIFALLMILIVFKIVKKKARKKVKAKIKASVRNSFDNIHNREISSDDEEEE